MTTSSWIRKLFTRKAPPLAIRPPTAPRTRLAVEALEERWVPTIDANVVLGGTLDINPISSITDYARMEVLTTTLPGLNHGTMYKVSLTEAYSWGSGAPNPFAPPTAPSFNQNRIFSGEGFRYVNDGTGLGETESIPVKFSDSTGANTVTDTIIIHINPADAAPKITTQPAGLTMITSGQTATLSVAATGQGPLGYQWYSGITPNASNPIAGATSPTFTTPVLSAGGQYLYWVRVSNAGGEVSSLNATVNVSEPTTTTASNPATVTYSRASQDLTWQATVSRYAPQLFGIADGAVTFDVPGVARAGNADATSISPGVDNVTGALTIPGGTHAGVYHALVSYAGNIPFTWRRAPTTARC